MRYDIIVLGGGPAGLSAAVAARGRNKSVLVVGNRWQDSPLARAERVDNYLGLPGVTGTELLEQFRRHAEELGADFVLGRVISLMAWNGFHLTVGSEIYEGETLILAPGVVRQAKYPGETEYLGRGVSYCATCDGMLYRGKPVAVVGRSGDAPREASYLKSLGCQVVYAAAKRPETLEEDIPFVQANRLEITGAQTVTALVADGAPIPCSGVFILRDAVAPPTCSPSWRPGKTLSGWTALCPPASPASLPPATAPAAPSRSPRRWAKGSSQPCPPRNIWTGGVRSPRPEPPAGPDLLSDQIKRKEFQYGITAFYQGEL